MRQYHRQIPQKERVLLVEERIKQLKQITEVQGNKGNFDYSEYMWGMYNGMELALAIMEDREPVYKNKPKLFTTDKDKIESEEKSFREKVYKWMHAGWGKR